VKELSRIRPSELAKEFAAPNPPPPQAGDHYIGGHKAPSRPEFDFDARASLELALGGLAAGPGAPPPEAASGQNGQGQQVKSEGSGFIVVNVGGMDETYSADLSTQGEALVHGAQPA
jgi:hypothetical protein